MMAERARMGFSQAYCKIPRFIARNVCGSEYVNSGQDMVHWPEMLDGFPAMHHDDQRALAAHVVYEELEEGVNRKGLVYVSDRVKPCRCGERHHAYPRSDGINWYPECDMEERLRIQFALNICG